MKTIDDILSYREMCDAENVQTLQRGMNFRLNLTYSVILMSQRSNAPYRDTLHPDGKTIEYEGHYVQRKDFMHNPKLEDQSIYFPSGKLTQNGLFVKAIENSKKNNMSFEKVKVYEKIMDGVWSLKGLFDLIDYKQVSDGNRKVFRFILKLSEDQHRGGDNIPTEIPHNRIIPSEVKRDVWKRDEGKCVLCGETKNLHFDHEVPYSKGGTSLSSKNVRLLCMKHNLEKSAKIQ